MREEARLGVGLDEHQREVHKLERRIAKLSVLLGDTEDALRKARLAGGGHGIASIYDRRAGPRSPTTCSSSGRRPDEVDLRGEPVCVIARRRRSAVEHRQRVVGDDEEEHVARGRVRGAVASRAGDAAPPAWRTSSQRPLGSCRAALHGSGKSAQRR